MTADKPTPVVPNLRFPEFRSAGDWHFQPLSDIAEPISERVGTSKCVPMSVTTGVGLLSQEEKFGRIIAGNSYKNYIRLQTNDFAYNKSATNEFPQGYIALYSDTTDAAVPNSIFTCFRPDAAAVIPEYLDHLLHGNHHGRWLRKYITVGARAHGALSVSDDALMSMPVPLPPVAVSRPEQQKIADCLGSLDDLIAAEGRKLDSLRQHKRGMMQQLFPQHDETMTQRLRAGGRAMTADKPTPVVPNLRFPEFRSAGDWHFQPLSDIAEPISERVGTSKCVPMSVTTGVGLLSQEEKFGRIIAGNSYKNYIRLQTNDFAYNKSATNEFPQGYIALYSGTTDAAVPNSIFTCFRPDAAAVIPEYLDHLLHGNHHGRWLRKYITVGARAHGALSVSDDALMSMPVPLPPVAVSRPEQQQIADCLGSLDDLIAAEGRKLDSLRQHKRGMMQQLFPSLEGH